MYEVAGGRVVSNYLAKVRVSGSNPVVRSKKRRVRRNGAPAAPSRRLGASSFDHRGALTASRRANSTAFRASAAASGAGSHWAGVLNRSSWDSWRAAYRPSSAAVASRLRASTCSPATRWPTRAAVMASHALIRRSLRYRQRHPIGRRRGFRLPRRATPPTWASRPGRHLGRRGDGGYAVESSCTADKVVELRTDEHDGIAANCAPEFASLLGFRSRFAAQVLEAVVEQLDRIASESLGLFGKAGKRGCPFVRVAAGERTASTSRSLSASASPRANDPKISGVSGTGSTWLARERSRAITCEPRWARRSMSSPAALCLARDTRTVRPISRRSTIPRVESSAMIPDARVLPSGAPPIYRVSPSQYASRVLAYCDMRTLYLRNVPDDVVERLERLAARDGASVAATAVKELAEATRRADNPALLGALPDVDLDTRTIIGHVSAGRAER